MEHEFDLRKFLLSYDVETVADELPVKVVDLRTGNASKSNFEAESLIEFYESFHPGKFKNVEDFARKRFVMFAST